MTTLSKHARVAGLLYLALILIAPVGLVVVPNLLLGSPNPALTAHSLAAHESLFRIAMFADLVTATIDVFLALALYRLLNGVDRGLAVLMVILGLMSTPIYFVNTAVNDGGALLFARGGEFLSAFSRPQQEAMTVLFLHLHHYGTVVNEVFWGLWLFSKAFSGSFVTSDSIGSALRPQTARPSRQNGTSSHRHIAAFKAPR